MRVTQAGFYNQATQQMGKQQAKVFDTQAQLSSGKKLLRPSDDPALAAALNNLKSQMDVNQRYLTNLERMQDTLSMQETSLSSSVELVARIKELSLQAANGTYNAQDRQNVAVEVQELISTLVDLGNLRGADGAYLFSGFSQNKAPFTQSADGMVAYTGTLDYQNALVDEGRLMKIGMPGSDVFGSALHLDETTGTSNSIEVFATLGAMHQALMENDVEAIADKLDKISSVHNHIITQQAKIGSRMQRVDTLTQVIEDRNFTYQALQSSMEDLDYVEAASRFKNQSLALQAGQQTFAQLSGLSLFEYIR